jgi:arginase family enzyme
LVNRTTWRCATSVWVPVLVSSSRRLEAEDHDVEMTVVADDDAPGYEIRRTFELDRQLAAVVRDAVVHRRFPLVIAGNCNSAIGTTAGVAAGGAKLAVAWFDAHADFDVPEDNRSGFFDVFALSIVTRASVPSSGAEHPRVRAGSAGTRRADGRP